MRYLRGQKYPQPKVIYVDVDETLIVRGQRNEPLIQWLWAMKKGEGYEINLWSSKGRAYAARVMRDLMLGNLFDQILGKPALIVDDQGWNWIQYTRVVDLPYIAEQHSASLEVNQDASGEATG